VEAGLAGEQDLGRRGEPAIDDLEQLDALHAGHDLIGDHQRDRLAVAGQLVEQRDRLVARARGGDLALVTEPRAELGAQHAQHALLVVDAHDHLAPAGRRYPRFGLLSAGRGHAAGSGRSVVTGMGSRTSNTVRPGSDMHRISPPCLSTIWRAIPRPRPVPSPLGLVVTNGSKIRGSTSGSTPGPSSITRTTAVSPS